MKKLMLGNEAIALGAYEAGVRVGSAYPGTPSTEIIENLSIFDEVYTEWAPNEKVALEVGIGAAIAGARALVAMKHVGVNVAADPLFTVSYTGVNAGLVIITADDPAMHSSQNEQDNRGYARMAKVPMLEPSDSQEAKDLIKQAFDISEEFDTPVFIRITTRLAHSQSLVSSGTVQRLELKPYVKNPSKYVMLPANARARHLQVDARGKKLETYSENFPFNQVIDGDPSFGIITSGVVYQYAREAFPQASFLKLGMTHPLPRKMIEDFVKTRQRVYVIEELEPIIEQEIKSWGLNVVGKDIFPRTGEFSSELIRSVISGQPIVSRQPISGLPGRPPVMCAGCPHRGVFFELSRIKATVSGDIGCYTLGALPPLSSMDACVCMGASIGMALGMEKARGREFARRLVAVIGDSTFIHSGITPLIDMVYNGGTSTIIILDNSTTAMTGHQHHPGTGQRVSGEPAPRLDLEKLLRAIGIEDLHIIDPLDSKQTRKVLKEAMASDKLSVIISRRPCVLLTPAEEGYYEIDEQICTNCKVCVRLGCPAIQSTDEKVMINAPLCMTCDFCAQICPIDAIQKRGS